MICLSIGDIKTLAGPNIIPSTQSNSPFGAKTTKIRTDGDIEGDIDGSDDGLDSGPNVDEDFDCGGKQP